MAPGDFVRAAPAGALAMALILAAMGAIAFAASCVAAGLNGTGRELVVDAEGFEHCPPGRIHQRLPWSDVVAIRPWRASRRHVLGLEMELRVGSRETLGIATTSPHDWLHLGGVIYDLKLLCDHIALDPDFRPVIRHRRPSRAPER